MGNLSNGTKDRKEKLFRLWWAYDSYVQPSQDSDGLVQRGQTVLRVVPPSLLARFGVHRVGSPVVAVASNLLSLQVISRGCK